MFLYTSNLYNVRSYEQYEFLVSIGSAAIRKLLLERMVINNAI